MAQTVVLLHTQPGKPDHYDWLIDQPQLEKEHRLLTFRVAARPDQHRTFIAEKAANHRAIYLHYQGPLTQDRGEVTRVACGTIDDLRNDTHQITGIIDWGNGPESFLATPLATAANQWQFRISPLEYH
ncbi:MAG: hypothetical protein ACF8MF_05785 [Phycisphaerales bacterium JB052]